MNPFPLWALIDHFMFVVSVPASVPAETLSERVCLLIEIHTFSIEGQLYCLLCSKNSHNLRLKYLN